MRKKTHSITYIKLFFFNNALILKDTLVLIYLSVVFVMEQCNIKILYLLIVHHYTYHTYEFIYKVHKCTFNRYRHHIFSKKKISQHVPKPLLKYFLSIQF